MVHLMPVKLPVKLLERRQAGYWRRDWRQCLLWAWWTSQKDPPRRSRCHAPQGRLCASITVDLPVQTKTPHWKSENHINDGNFYKLGTSFNVGLDTYPYVKIYFKTRTSVHLLSLTATHWRPNEEVSSWRITSARQNLPQGLPEPGRQTAMPGARNER